MNVMFRAACAAVVVIAAGAEVASAETRDIRLSAAGEGAEVVACVGPATCPSTGRLSYSAEVTGEPFSDFAFYRGPVLLSGHLDLQQASFDPATRCFSDVTGVFELSTRRGMRTFLAFAEHVLGTYCTHPSGDGAAGSFQGTYQVDSAGAQDPHFRDATGSGAIVLQDNLDPSTLGTGAFTRDDNGTITMRR